MPGRVAKNSLLILLMNGKGYKSVFLKPLVHKGCRVGIRFMPSLVCKVMGKINVTQQVSEGLKERQTIDFIDFMKGSNNADGEWE